MKQPVEYKLIDPFTFGSESFESLTFKPLKAKHLRKASKDFSMGDLINIAGDLAGLSREEIGEMGAEDTIAVIKIVTDFLQSGPSTGQDTTQS